MQSSVQSGGCSQRNTDVLTWLRYADLSFYIPTATATSLSARRAITTKPLDLCHPLLVFFSNGAPYYTPRFPTPARAPSCGRRHSGLRRLNRAFLVQQYTLSGPDSLTTQYYVLCMSGHVPGVGHVVQQWVYEAAREDSPQTRGFLLRIYSLSPSIEGCLAATGQRILFLQNAECLRSQDCARLCSRNRTSANVPFSC